MDEPYEEIISDEGKEEENESEEDEIGETNKKWEINLKEEELFWTKMQNKDYIFAPKICPTCNFGTYEIKKYTNPNCINIFYCRCNNTKCRKKCNLRYYSVFRLAKKVPASIVYKIIEKFILEGSNAHELFKYINNTYKIKLAESTLQKILKNIRYILAEYMKKNYDSSLIGGINENNIPRIVAIDESLFLHDSLGNQIWVVGGIETKELRMRLNVINLRNSENLETFIFNNFKEGTHFTHDGWSGYTFLNNNINFTHETHIHGGGDFGLGYHSTSHIENLWANLKKTIRSIYGIMPKKDFILYLREAEFRINISKKKSDEKLDILFKIIRDIYEFCNFNFSSITELEDINNY